MIKIKNLTVVLNNQTILKDISCNFETGSFSLLVGKSGGGKTTLLKTIAGLYNPFLGSIQYVSKNIGYVFQEYNLFNNCTVLENCTDPLIIQGIPKTEAQKIALKQLQTVGMETYNERYPWQLSGGQKQRVAIARALCLNPDILLLDEPTSALDQENTKLLITLLKKLQKSGLTLICSSQDIYFTKQKIDQIYLVKDGLIQKKNPTERIPLG